MNLKNVILISILICGLLIAPVSAAAGDTILFEQVNISKNITQIWNNGSFQVYPVVQGVTSTDNIDQSLDSGWAAANTYALGTSVSESATNIQTFTPTKSKITNISIYITATGTGLTWYLVVHDASNNVLASNSFTPVSGVNSISVPTLWTSGNLHFHVYASATTGTPTIKSGTTNDLETGSYIQYYAKNTESVNVTVNGNTTMLDTSEANGILVGATVDTYRGLYNWTSSSQNIISAVNSASFGGALSSDGSIINGWFTTFFPSIQTDFSNSEKQIVFKVNTILPVEDVTVSTNMYSSTTSSIKTVSVSHDNTTWHTISTLATNSAGSYSNSSTTQVLKGNKTFYVRLMKTTGANEYLSFYIDSRFKINATLNTTTSNATVLTYQTGTNTVNLTSYGNVVSSSLDPSLQANVSLIEGESLNSITADFTISNSSGIEPLLTHFTDTSTTNEATIDAWLWDFGDGNTSTSQSPSHLYEVPGTYQANMTITNTSYSLVSSKDQTITVNNYPPVANFIASNMSGQSPLPVAFTDTSTGNNITVWDWDFGDGNTSSLQNPEHTFESVGEYQVNLTVTNDGGSSIKLQNVSVVTFGADFTASNTSGNPPLYVQFTDTTTGIKVDEWQWDFGDGNTSILQSPSHLYEVPGTYQANMTITNTSYSLVSSKDQTITVNNYPPVANFIASNMSGQPPLPVAFTDTSTGNNITVWNWDFGDGNTSSLQNPTHIFADNGTYTVNLTVVNDGGSSTKLQDIIVSFFAPAYTATPSSGLAPLTVQFTETTTGKIPDSYYWEFGDGGTDNVQNPVHVYNSVGVYNVNHRITNESLVVWNNKTAFIHVNQTPAADFTGTPLSGYLNPATMSVSFTDMSIGEGISQWSWNFGDGSANATTKNPSHAYALPGTYSVFLKVWGADGNASVTKPGYITVNPLTADFTTSTVASNVGIPIFFNDTSDGYPTSWYWDFGDGTISTTKNNSYAYASTGTYTVKFRVTNGVETSWKNETNLITISGALPPAPIVDFEAIPVSASTGSAIQFYDLSGNAPSSWAWEFGDGSTSTLKNPSHTYAATGSYTVNLTATNSGGSDTESKTGYITITTLPPPTAAFSASSTLTYVGGTVSFTDESTGSPTSWSWNFGDGTTSSLRNPGHSYTSAGTYTVILTATNVYGSDVLTKPAYITVEAVPPTIPPTSYVITNPATGTTNNAVTMNGYTAATTYKYHFEYGLKSSTYSYSTKPKDGVAGNFSVTVEGLPLLPDETYYFRAVIQEDGGYVSGNELTYLTSPDSGIDSYPEFEEREEALIESNWEFEKLLEVIPSPFVDTMGNIFWGIIFGGAFFILWARTHKIVIPALFGIISGGMLWNIMPPSWVAFGSAMFYLSIAALVYWIILGRQS